MSPPLTPVLEIMADNGHIPLYFNRGVGKILSHTFNKQLYRCHKVFPHLPRGRTLFTVGDFSGQHAKQHFDTYSFLIFDLDRNSEWLRLQQNFRDNVFTSNRRMSFKQMNDAHRRRVLVPFMQMASRIEGYLILFAISKKGGSMFHFSDTSDEKDKLLSVWKPVIQERLLRIVHLSAFILSGLSVPQQYLLWIIDQDEIAANISQLTSLTNVFARVFSNCANHDLRHLRCGTTQYDDGSLVLEDLAAIPDLTAGAFSEICTGFIDQSRFPGSEVVVPIPTGLTWKSHLIGSWIACQERPLRQLSCVIELEPSSTRLRATILKWHAIPGQIIDSQNG